MISVKAEHLSTIKSLGEAAYPNECCGLLIGRTHDDGRKVVVETFEITNAIADGAQHDRSLITPQDLMRGEKYARSKQLDVIGNYHSHPDWPAKPSQFDLDHAWPTWSYIIVSVPDRKATDIFSWELEPDRSRFNSENIDIAKED
ncbi:MAG: M67 family metallopeptidase [Vicinamibacteria bacterium]